ncbi:hypothetical protein [Embleya scabrispora]|uniref:hypothetical protein n=1 Tax=Embleya scabrispora TaxID=159449 RepID=UPI00131A0E2A|nr:hypothetical protein [Embleya scabrispora]MYS84617.1 hypothetical protein [Streptomyces sp. SID5474]
MLVTVSRLHRLPHQGGGCGLRRTVLSHLRAPSGSRFSAAVTPGRNKPLRLSAEPVEDRFAFFVYLTPNGDDDVCHLQMEINPIDAAELRDMFDALLASLAL